MSAKVVKFKAEVKEVLNIVINSLYSHKDIFLRELISNASDAIDKLRFEALTNEKLLGDDTEFKIKIIPDKEKGTLTVSDNGIGMNQQEIIKNLGTIAHSNTREFLEKLKEQKVSDIDLIGQFGVGFYSSFMVADKVTVISKKAGSTKAVKWESNGDGEFIVDEADKKERGTDVILHLKEDEKKYLEDWEIREIVKKYSDFIEYPIILVTEKESTIAKGEKVKEEEILNSQKALWLRDKSSIKESEYNEFYKHISKDFNDPLKVIHYKVEGTVEFTALLYIPSKVPFNIFFPDYKYGIMLYVNRVLIMDSCKELLPPYLRFVKGVVESADLPLNISREMLQHNRQIEIIRKNLVSKILDTLKQMKKDEFDNYKKFYSEFGKILKEGIHTDFGRREEIASLLIFQTTKTKEDEYIDFDKYIENMVSDQKEIYYITGGSKKELESSPYLEAFNDKNIEVIFFTEEIDDFIMESLIEYKGKKLKSVIKGDIDIAKDTSQEKELQDFLKFIKDTLKDKVKDVRFSGRLKESPCCLVAEEGDMDPKLAEMFKAMGNQFVPEVKRVLEVNPNHSLIKKLNELYKQDKKKDSLKDYVEILYNQALLLEGSKLEDPAKFVKNISNLMTQAIVN